MGHTYLECISGQELERLQSQHEAWLPETHSFLRDAGFDRADRIVEFGCGPGITTLDLATEINPTARITALDISEYYLNHLRNQIAQRGLTQVEVVQQSASAPVPFDGQFDMAFCRWFLAWVTSELDAVLKNVHASLRPGGTFAAMEYLTLKSTVQSPPLPQLAKYLNAWEEFYKQAGGTTEIGAMLPARLKLAGFEVTNLRCVGGYSPWDGRLFRWWERLFKEFGVRFVEKGLIGRDECAAMESYWQSASLDRDAFIYSPVLLQVTAVKR